MKKSLVFKILYLFLVLIVVAGASVFATNTYLASQVSYSKSDGTEISVANALNELYLKILKQNLKKQNGKPILMVWYTRKNGFVIINFNCSTLITIPANSTTASFCIGTLPEDYWPSKEVFSTITYCGLNVYCGCCRITTNGKIYLCGKNSGTYVTGEIIY